MPAHQDVSDRHRAKDEASKDAGLLNRSRSMIPTEKDAARSPLDVSWVRRRKPYFRGSSLFVGRRVAGILALLQGPDMLIINSIRFLEVNMAVHPRRFGPFYFGMKVICASASIFLNPKHF